jgi:predicted HTH transcriptional regulator
MTAVLDLDYLLRRENEQVEWKENVADVLDVVKAVCAFANDWPNFGGGYVICGAKETKDEWGHPRVERVGLIASEIKRLEGQVLRSSREYLNPPVVPVVQVLDLPDPERKILVFQIAATKQAHLFTREGAAGTCWIRVSSNTIEARNGLSRELMVRKLAVEPWDQRVCAGATVDDIDLFVYRDAMRDMGVVPKDRSAEEFLSDEMQLNPFVLPLCVREPLTGVLRPRNFTMLLFGKRPQRWVAGSGSLFVMYPGTSVTSHRSERLEIAGTLIEQYRKLWLALQGMISNVLDKGQIEGVNAFKYPERAIQEALSNALAHRSYEDNQPTRVTVFVDRIEFNTPGGLPTAIEKADFQSGRPTTRWRNQSLAWFFHKLRLAQASGQGVRSMFEAMHENGNEPPVMDPRPEYVVCTLRAHPRAISLVALSEVEKAIRERNYGVATSKLTVLLSGDLGNEAAWRLLASIADERDSEVLRALFEKAEAAGISLAPDVLVSLVLLLGAIQRDLQARILDSLKTTDRDHADKLGDFAYHTALELKNDMDHQRALEWLDRAWYWHRVWVEIDNQPWSHSHMDRVEQLRELWTESRPEGTKPKSRA